MPSTKQESMLNSVILLALSWVIAIGGGIAGVFFLLFYSQDLIVFLKGVALIFFCFVVAAATRMLANIGQLLFDMKKMGEETKNSYERIDKKIDYLKNFFSEIEKHLEFKK